MKKTSSFPTNGSEIDALIMNEELARLLCQAAMDKMTAAINFSRFIVTTVQGLRTSWQMRDPGKYQEAFFFLDNLKNRVVVREYMPPGTKVALNREEWAAYCSTLPHGVPFDMVPPSLPVVTLKDVLHGECPHCKKSLPVIESYEQMYDSPGGDTWQKRVFTVCPTCSKINIITRRESANRF